ncbi:hypothetical protein HZH68_001865 [Vespula germanica]|uniref:Uncharacterized protein n=1 Tax=Vespula germanica TaxID=30212 RepID=A0A834KUV8_VESGE|nr:hypothetical protein HZH68_001865 [Vespula germanica]
MENLEHEFRNMLLDEVNMVDNLCLIGNGVDVKTLCTGMNQQHNDKIWIVYSDESKLYYMTMTLSTEIYKKVKTEEKSFVCIQYYKEDKFVGLTKTKELHELSINVIENYVNEEISKDDFIDLHRDMLKDTDLIVEQIYEKAKELELIAKQLFLNIDFQENLPKNVYIVCSLISNYETTFSIKEIANNETSIDLPIAIKKLLNSLQIRMDLVTIINEEQPWFLIKDFVTDPIIERKKNLKEKQGKRDKTNFINAKINLIRNLMLTENLTMKKLSEIKKKIRKEICDF